jgi:putative transposase
MRTVKRKASPMNCNKQTELKKLARAFTKEVNYWLNILKSWKFQALLGSPRKIRDHFVADGYKSLYGLQARHWKLALQDAVETWDKYWQALFTDLRPKISFNKNLSDTERHYARWLLTNYARFAEMMQGKDPSPSHFHIEKSSRDKVARFIQRTIKKLKGKSPSTKKGRIIKFDANCNDAFEHNNKQYLKVMSLVPGKRIVIPLQGMTKIEGNITLVLGEDLHVHICQEIKKPKQSPTNSIEAVDFGYTEVMTDTAGTAYGKQFGVVLTKASNELHEKMQKRHKLHALEKKARLKDPKKAKRIRKYNLGRKKLTNHTQKVKATLEKEINTGINELLKKKNPSTLVTEDLRHTFTYNKPKEVNRKLSSWVRGKLQDRVEFKALAEGFRHEQVNPAYGSQLCPLCGFVDKKNRQGDSFKCLYCRHEDISERVAALNYLKRYGDNEIGLGMPPGQVKTILSEKFHRRLEAEKSATVPGRTLDTVTEVSPRLSVETLEIVIAGGGNS